MGPLWTVGLQALQTRLDTPAIPWKALVNALLWGVYVFETYVSWRQYRMYSRTAPPPALAGHVSADDFRKSQRYGRDKMRFSMVSDAVMHVVSLVSVNYNASAHMWGWGGELLRWLRVAPSEQALSAAHMLVTTVCYLPLKLVLEAYRAFVIEARHGFNKQTWGTFGMDHVKQLLLSVVLGAPLVALLVSVIRWAGDAFVVYTVLLVLAVTLFGSVIFPTFIQPLFNTLTPVPEGRLRDRVTALATSLRFPLKHLYVIDGSKRSSHSNAYFYGVVPGGSKHIVLYDTLIEHSTPAEIEAVLAHELGHWSYSHPVKMMAVSYVQIAALLTLFTAFIHNASLYEAFGFRGPPLPVWIGLELFSLVLHPLDALLQFGMHAMTRQMEYAADAFAVRLPRPQGADDAKTYQELLQSSLIKLQVHNLSTMHHDALFSAYHHSHPTLPERLAAIERAAKTE